jgi:hypothetical protein
VGSFPPQQPGGGLVAPPSHQPPFESHSCRTGVLRLREGTRAGILLATIIAIPIETMANGWQIALGIAAVPATVLAAGIWKFPEVRLSAVLGFALRGS